MSSVIRFIQIISEHISIATIYLRQHHAIKINPYFELPGQESSGPTVSSYFGSGSPEEKITAFEALGFRCFDLPTENTKPPCSIHFSPIGLRTYIGLMGSLVVLLRIIFISQVMFRLPSVLICPKLKIMPSDWKTQHKTIGTCLAYPS